MVITNVAVAAMLALLGTWIQGQRDRGDAGTLSSLSLFFYVLKGFVCATFIVQATSGWAKVALEEVLAPKTPHRALPILTLLLADPMGEGWTLQFCPMEQLWRAHFLGRCPTLPMDILPKGLQLWREIFLILANEKKEKIR